MPRKRIDRTGQRYGMWTVVSFHSKYRECDSKWNCKCDCGTEKIVIFSSLRDGNSKSCGCDTVRMRVKKLTKHGMAGTPTYKSWHQMHQRCAGKNGHEYYKNQGITVCDRWISFEYFFADMGLRPFGTTLDRIDGRLGYSQQNCRWASTETQANNKKSCRPENVFGEQLTPAQASRKYNCHISGVRHRLRKGWTLEQAVSTPFIVKKGTLMPDGTFVKEV